MNEQQSHANTITQGTQTINTYRIDSLILPGDIDALLRKESYQMHTSRG